MCTVEVSNLKEVPRYACVSHTWGRWREDKPPVRLPGVEWLVPTNTRVRVQNLPQQLKDSFASGYLWFNLLCIPQDRSPLALSEIARQAEIFGGAISAIAW